MLITVLTKSFLITTEIVSYTKVGHYQSGIFTSERLSDAALLNVAVTPPSVWVGCVTPEMFQNHAHNLVEFIRAA